MIPVAANAQKNEKLGFFFFFKGEGNTHAQHGEDICILRCMPCNIPPHPLTYYI